MRALTLLFSLFLSAGCAEPADVQEDGPTSQSIVLVDYQGHPDFIGEILKNKKNWVNPRLKGKVEFLANYQEIKTRLVSRLVLTAEDGMVLLPCRRCETGRVPVGIIKFQGGVKGRFLGALRELGEHSAIGILSHLVLAACCGI